MIVNNVRASDIVNRSGLSALQVSILEALELSIDRAVRTAIIIDRVGFAQPSLAERVSVSRALARLYDRGLVERWNAEISLQGRGYLWRAIAFEVSNDSGTVAAGG